MAKKNLKNKAKAKDKAPTPEDNLKGVSDEQQSKHIEIITELKKFKEGLELKWRTSAAFWDGIHFTTGEMDRDGRVTRLTSKRPVREIPIAKRRMKDMRNMLISNKPLPFVYPDEKLMGGGELDDNMKTKVWKEMDNYSRAVEYVLTEEARVHKKMKKLIRYGLTYSVGYLQVYKDEDKGYIIEPLDPFDISIYPTIETMSDYPYVVKHIAKPIYQLKDKYPAKVVKELEKMKEEGKFFSSDEKNRLYISRLQHQPKDTVVLDELYAVEKDGLAIYTYGGEKLLKVQTPADTKLKNLPFAMFLTGDEPYEQSPMEELIPINRVLDVLITKLEGRIKNLDAGRIALQQNEPLKVLKTADFQVVRYKRNAPTVLPEENYPSTLYQLVGIFNGIIDDLSVSVAVNPAKTPKGVEAYRAIESLKQSDYGKIQDLTDNLNDCLTEITERLIELISVTEGEVRNIIDPESLNQISITGGLGAEKPAEGVVKLDPQRRLKVVIESGITHTPQAKREFIMSLVEKQLLPRSVAIEMLKVGNTRDILNKMKTEELDGMSLVDMPDFKVLPKKLQAAIAQYLQGGAKPVEGLD